MDEIKITFNNGEIATYPKGIGLFELSKYYQGNMSSKIIGAKIDNTYHRLDDKVLHDCKIDFIDYNDIDGYGIFKSGLKFVLYVAIKELYGNKTDVFFINSIDKGMYVKITDNIKLNEKIVADIKEKMQEIIDLDFPISMQYVKNTDAIEYYKSINQDEKAANVMTSTNSTLVMYKLKNYFNFFYTMMPSSTGVLDKFDLSVIDGKHFVLRYPTPSSKNKIPEYKEHEKTLKAFEDYRDWLNIVKIPYLSDLNDTVSKSAIHDFILMNYIVSENNIYEIAKNIYKQNEKTKVKIIFLSGPSSSGKTTTSKKLSMHLKTVGMDPYPISCDDFYKEREDSPKLPDGSYDFESIDALDLKLLKETLNKLINREPVQLPTFNFFTGKKEFKNKPVTLDDNTVIVFEGLHCLNDKITSLVEKEEQYKLYISPFPGLNIDRHNYISSVDLRLIRRMVRDNIFRGYNVEQTMASWQKVRDGEEKYVFPYQDAADAVLNSSLVYEIGVLRVFAEPLLSSVSVESNYYEEAKRLLNFVRGFFSINPEYVSRDSVLREFIGDLIFK